MSKPYLSFVIPSFNRAKLIERAIDSVLSDEKSKSNSLEVIVVDDGSTDDTESRIRRFQADTRFRYFRQPTNSGVAAARNIGIKAANGAWIALLDSDNFLVPGSLPALTYALEKLPEEVGVFWGNCITSEGITTLKHKTEGIVPGLGIVLNMYGGEHFSVIRSEIAKAHLFAELGTRNECAACFWYPIGLSTKLFLSQTVFQYYETVGDDRVTSVKTRLTRAPELEICFREILLRFGPILKEKAPNHYWAVKGKIAFYSSVSGKWFRSILNAIEALHGANKAPSNVLIFLLVLAGPFLTRTALQTKPQDIDSKKKRPTPGQEPYAANPP